MIARRHASRLAPTSGIALALLAIAASACHGGAARAQSEIQMSDKPKTPSLPNPDRNPPPPPPPHLVTVTFTVTPPEAAARAAIKVCDLPVQGGETVFQVNVDTKVVVTAPGYQPWEKTLKVDKNTNIKVDLQPRR